MSDADRKVGCAWWLALGACAFVIGVLVALGLFARLGEAMFATITASQQHLVYQTDHAVVLDACDWLRAHRDEFRTPDGRHSEVAGHFTSDPNRAKLPVILEQMDFEDITIEPDNVLIMFGGGMAHWGLSCGPQQSLPRDWNRWELRPNLYYWSEGAGGYPPDPSKKSWLRLSTKFFLAAAIVAAMSTVLFIHWHKRITGESDPSPSSSPATRRSL